MPKKKKLKSYEVEYTGYCTVLVIGAKSEEEALEFASNELSTGDFQIDEGRVGRVVPDDELESARRIADCVSEE